VQGVVIVERLPQQPVNEKGLREDVGELRRIIAQGGLDLGQHVRCARGGVDALHLGVEQGGSDGHAVGLAQRGFLLQVQPHETFERSGRKRLLEGRFLPQPMVVTSPLDGRPVPQQRGHVIRPCGGANGQQEEEPGSHAHQLPQNRRCRVP
jgi:hypothetical protein